MPAKKTAAKKLTKAKTAVKAKPAPAEEKTSANNGKVAAFTFDDVKSLLKNKKPDESTTEVKAIKKVAKKVVKADVEEIPQAAPQNYGAASLADILGYSPGTKPKFDDDSNVPKKFKVYYDLLIELRNHVNDELDLHKRETLKKSRKEDSGDIAGYSQHMADQGTDTFDRDFALSVVTNEQEALTEIKEAIRRIFDGTYGVCEITGESINKERLMAVPFTKHSIEGQKQLEKNKRNTVQRGGIYSTGIEDSTQFLANDDGD